MSILTPMKHRSHRKVGKVFCKTTICLHQFRKEGYLTSTKPKNKGKEFFCGGSAKSKSAKNRQFDSELNMPRSGVSNFRSNPSSDFSISTKWENLKKNDMSRFLLAQNFVEEGLELPHNLQERVKNIITN